MLDSLDSVLIDSALALLRIDPWELGYDKMWVDDDTFRLDVVEYYLSHPLELAKYVDSTYKVVSQFKNDPPRLISFVESQLSVTLDEKKKISYHFPDVYLPQYDPYDPFKTWKYALQQAEPLIKAYYGALDSLDLHDVIMAAPVMWSEAPDSVNKHKRGEWQREKGIPVDTSRKVDSDRLLDIAKKLDMHALFQAGVLLISAAQITARGAAEFGVSARKESPKLRVLDGEVIYWEETSWGLMIVGGEGSNIYHSPLGEGEGAVSPIDLSLILDLGGDDIYKGRIGGCVGGLSRTPASAVIDLKGNDFYQSHNFSLTQGAGFLGVGILIDREGDDVYLAGDYSQGAGLWGIGVLADYQGDDDRRAGYFAQGAGHFGFGYLLDTEDILNFSGASTEQGISFAKGDDRYLASAYAQGLGGTRGYGLIWDEGGDDNYRCGGVFRHEPLLPKDYRSFSGGFGMGWRPRAGGGIGILLDRGDGNDFYDAEVMAFGSSYWYSLGILVDDGGNDRYSLAHYGLGSGIHLSLGAFYDRKGDDQYRSRMGVVGGTPHDLSVGIFVDGEGNDSYGDCDGWGGSLTNSVGIFIDRLGDDVYFPRPGTSLGRHNWARGFGGVAIFIDEEGKDLYPIDEYAADSTIWFEGWGVGIDLARDVTTEKEESIPDPELTAEDSLKSIEDLFREASQWEVGSARASVKRARKALKLRPEAPRWAIENYISTQNGLELRALEDLVKSFPDSSGPLLMTYLKEENDRWTLSNSAYLLGAIKWEQAAPVLVKLLDKEKTEKSHRAFIGALGQIGTVQAKTVIGKFVSHPKERNRLAAINAAATIKDTTLIPSLLTCLNDPLFTVRSCAMRNLPSWGPYSVPSLIDALHQKKLKDLSVGYQALGLIGNSLKDSTSQRSQNALLKIREELELGLFSDDPKVRAEALRALYPLVGEKRKNWLLAIAEDDPHPSVQAILKLLLKKGH
ncbi:MAG: HEAT repeat domain-containing protein [bacterium]